MDFDPGSLPKDPSKRIPGVFYHGIILNGEYGWYAAANLSESEMLMTPNYLSYINREIASWHQSICEQKIEELMSDSPSQGVLTPRAIDYIDAAGRFELGLPPQKRFSSLANEKIEEMLSTRDIEMEFEKGRRRIAPNAASRLDCLFVADNVEIIQKMFNNDPELVILKVKVAEALRFTRADIKWTEKYAITRDKRCIESYWNSCQFEKGVNNWEFLVDGLIVADDEKGLKYVRSYYSNLKSEYNEIQ